MKKTVWKSGLWLTMLLGLFACQNVEKNNSPDKRQGQSTSVEFLFDLGDIAESPSRTLDETCPGSDEIKTLIEQDNIWAEFQIKDANGQAVDVGDKIELNFVNIGAGQIITDPIIFDIDYDGEDASEACYYVEQVTIYKLDDDDNPQALYSSMSSTSINSGWVDKSCLLTPYANASEPSFCIDEENIYQKVTIDVCVFCTYDKDATYFGYLMWNIEFKRMICVPFFVNICDAETFKDTVGTGTIEVRSGTLDNTDQFVSDDKEYGTIPFPTGQLKLADLCFVDEMDVPNGDEWYELTMRMDDGRVFKAVTNVAELLTYESRPEYDAERHFIHFWFCEDRDNWFFEASDCGDLPFYFTLPTDLDMIKDHFVYVSKGEAITSDNSLPGLPNYEQLTASSNYITIPAETSFAITTSYTFTDDGEMSTTITVGAVPQTLNDGAKCFFTLYDKSNPAAISTITRVYDEMTGLNMFRANFEDFSGLVQGNCYYVLISFSEDVAMRDISINNYNDDF